MLFKGYLFVYTYVSSRYEVWKYDTHGFVNNGDLVELGLHDNGVVGYGHALLSVPH